MLLPSKFSTQRCEFIPVSDTGETKAKSHRKFTKRSPGHVYQLVMKSPPIHISMIRELSAFVEMQNGKHGAFDVIIPYHSDTLGEETNAISVSAAYLAGATVLNIKDLTPNLVGALKSGDFVRFDNHSKVYKSAFDVDADASGLSTITLTKPLLSALSTNEGITYNQVPFTVSFLEDKWNYYHDAKEGGYSPITFRLEERLSL